MSSFTCGYAHTFAFLICRTFSAEYAILVPPSRRGLRPFGVLPDDINLELTYTHSQLETFLAWAAESLKPCRRHLLQISCGADLRRYWYSDFNR